MSDSNLQVSSIEKQGIEEITNELIESMPEVSEHVIDVHESEKQSTSDLTDKYGNIFNPKIHKTNADGTPVVNKKDGRLALKPGRKAGSSSSGKKHTSKLGNLSREAKSVPDDTIDYNIMGRDIVCAITSIPAMTISPAWTPSETEINELARPTAKLLEKYGIKDIPPWTALTIAVFGYAIPRVISDQTTQSKLKGLSKIKDFVVKSCTRFGTWIYTRIQKWHTR